MKRNNNGFSLVEIVAAIAILGIFFGTACSALVLGLRMNERTDAKLQAQLAVSSAVETLMAEGISTENGAFSTTTKKDENGVDITDIEGNKTYVETGSYNERPSKDENGVVTITNPFPDVQVTTEREKIGEDTEFPPYFKVTVTSETSDITVTTYIREKAVTGS